MLFALEGGEVIVKLDGVKISDSAKKRDLLLYAILDAIKQLGSITLVMPMGVMSEEPEEPQSGKAN